jgi:hypothetical protein
MGSENSGIPGFISEAAKPAPWYLDFTGVVGRHGLLLFLTLLVSAASGYYLGTNYKTEYWTIDARLRHVKQPAIDGSRGNYEPMSLATYADLLTSEDMMRPTAAQFEDRLPKNVEPVRYLQKELKVDTPRMSDVIEIKTETASPQLAIDVISKLTTRFIDAANTQRRLTVLRQTGELLKHKIVDLGAQIGRIDRIAKEYLERVNANVPIEKLDAAEIDSYHAQRRKSLLDLIETERTRIKERKIDLESKIQKLRRLERHYDLKIATHLEVVDAAADVRTLQEQIKINDQQIKTLEDNYRKVPIEYANSRKIDLETQKVIAEQDLKLIEKKSTEAKERGISILEIDPQDGEWSKLRQRILGADSSEFVVIKEASWPSSPTSSNRKALTLVGAAIPLVTVVLLLGFVDHRRKIRTNSTVGAPIEALAPETPLSPPFRDESALLSLRIQQWIAGDSNSKLRSDQPPDRVVIQPKRDEERNH